MGRNCFIGFDNQKAVGILILDYDANELISIYISPDLLYQGYGSQLITFALDELDSEQEICLIVMNVNKNARKFYEKNLTEMAYVYRGL